MRRLMIISSDSHVAPPMADFRPYLEERYLDDFDAFLIDYEKHGSRIFEPASLRYRLDAEEVDRWDREVIQTGKVLGASSVKARREFMDVDGVTADVVFPDFGRPFEMIGTPSLQVLMKKAPDPEHIAAGTRAYNRWLTDFVQEAGERSAAMAPSGDWSDIEATIQQMRSFKEAGFKGVVLPRFDPAYPLYHPNYDPIWRTIVELDLVANSHPPMSMTTTRMPTPPADVHQTVATHMIAKELMWYTRNILDHVIWGGVLERHPLLRVVLTEQQSGWVIPAVADMDYSYTGSFVRRDVRELLPLKPSEYFRRQVYLGASIFSRGEVGVRHLIGIDQMMMGMDYPHHEGTLGSGGTRAYLRATFGAEQVPEDEARRMLGETAIEVFRLDKKKLTAIADRIGPLPSEVLEPPADHLDTRGDVHRPVATAKT